MAVLTDLASAEVKRHVNKLYGTTMTRPTLLLSDGQNVAYVCDVNIGAVDPTGRINQYLNDKKKGQNPDDDLITGIPGQRPSDWQLDDSLPGHVDTTLHNVPIARNNTELMYADVGAPVVVTRANFTAQWEITGFSIEQPGTHRLYPVDLGDMSIGTVIDLSITTRLLTLAEFGELRAFGDLPMGASAIFEGGELLSIV